MASRLPGVGKNDSLMALTARELFVDHSYQREADDAAVARIAAAYDPRLVGIIEVSAREDDRYAIIEGQHRWLATMEADPRGPDTPVVCRIHINLTVADEARLFHDFAATRKPISTWDKWKARRAAGDEVVLDIDAIAEGCGFTVGMSGRKPYVLQAMGRLEGIYNRDGRDALGRVLLIIGIAWNGDPDAGSTPILTGVAEVIRTYGDQLNDEAFAAALDKTDPVKLIEASHGYEMTLPGPIGNRVAAALVKTTNGKVSRGHKLVDYLLLREQQLEEKRAKRGEQAKADADEAGPPAENEPPAPTETAEQLAEAVTVGV